MENVATTARMLPTASTEELFDRAYSAPRPAYGEQPSSALGRFLEIPGRRGVAIDLGAGGGRDALAIAAAGYYVFCFDQSSAGLRLIDHRARRLGLQSMIESMQSDVRSVNLVPNCADLITATTVLDHVPLLDSLMIWHDMLRALTERGALYVEVHTTEDPGCRFAPQETAGAQASETAEAVINHFLPGQLLAWAVAAGDQLRVLHYEERREWDRTHGPEHLHAKSVLLAEKKGANYDWRGIGAPETTASTPLPETTAGVAGKGNRVGPGDVLPR